MFKYSPINPYSLQNLLRSQIFFNNPLDFNDPFDTFHPVKVKELGNETFANLFCKSNDRFEEKSILKILNDNISKEELYDFCKEHIEYFIEFDEKNENIAYRSKENYLSKIEKSLENSLPQEIEYFFQFLKSKIGETIIDTLKKLRQNQFAKIGVTCFSKNNNNLLMWSHYADSHKGMCLEFDSELEPFSKKFEVTYDLKIPNIETDLLFEKENKLESFQKLLSFKSKDWEHEEELRLLHREKNKKFTYPRYALKAIYFGLKTDQADLEIVCSLVKTNNPSIRFFRMTRLESKFEIVPKEFFYSTPVEVQSKLLIEISNSFDNRKFDLEELFSLVKIHIPKQNLKSHLEEFVRVGILEKTDEKYYLKK